METADPAPLSEAIRLKMVAQPSRDTKPELLLRRALHALGYRYRLNVRVPGAPRRSIDIAFPGRKLAIMVDGCYWHCCPEHGHTPKNNAQWWAEKLSNNTRRDVETTQLLEDAGWRVLRIWEHETVSEAVQRVKEALGPPTDSADHSVVPPDSGL